MEKRGAVWEQEGIALSYRIRNNLDLAWKEALVGFLPDFLALFQPHVHRQIDWSVGPEFLENEVRRLRRALPGQVRPPRGQRQQVDLVLKVRLLEGQEALVLVHIEVQNQKDPHFELRMRLYHDRLFDRYGLPVYSLAILGDANPSWRPGFFHTDVWGCSTTFRFPVIKLLDWKDRRQELEASNNPFALVVAAHLAVLETRPEEPARLQRALHLVRLLLRRGFRQDEVDGIFRLLEAIMTMSEGLADRFDREVARLEEEHAVKLITRSELRGMKKGRQEGRQEGRLEGHRRALHRVVLARFGEAPAGLEEALEAIGDLEALMRLVELAVTVPSAAEFLTAARRQAGAP